MTTEEENDYIDSGMVIGERGTPFTIGEARQAMAAFREIQNSKTYSKTYYYLAIMEFLVRRVDRLEKCRT